MAESNRGPWIIAIATLLALGAVIGTWAYVRQQDQACVEWQRRYREFPEDGVFDYVNLGPRAALRDERPDGCAVPKVSP